ncbi:MAG: vitamin K epoxide reductase family protein [Armatimonadota bacterium]|nr:vitamin K epoxide reductase family protein [Armatimonadota bacterium]
MLIDILCSSILLLSLAGLADSLYFTLVYYGYMRPDARFIPAICQMENSACKTVLESKYARVFSIPNSLLGLPYYALTASICLIHWIYGTWLLLPYALIASAIAVAFSAYLTRALIYKLRQPCPLCFLAHAINLLLLALLAGLIIYTK